MKTFDDLIFDQESDIIKQAVLNFNNGYGVSVILGNMFYSNGIDTYELAVLYNNEIIYDTIITNDVCPYVTSEQITEIMKKVQMFKSRDLNYIKFTNNKNNNILFVEKNDNLYYKNSLEKYKKVNNLNDEDIMQTLITYDEIQQVEYDFIKDIFDN